MSEAEAWKFLAQEWRRLAAGKRRTRYVRHGICDSTYVLCWHKQISFNVFDRMTAKIKTLGKSLGFGYTIFWPLNKAGYKARSEFCARMAFLCSS